MVTVHNNTSDGQSPWLVRNYGPAVVTIPQRFAAFDPLPWFASGRADAQAVSEGGRQAAWFVSDAHGPAVLRHYRRGGWRAKLGADSYFWLGEQRVRAFAEVRVLLHLRHHGVAVPEPLAAMYRRHGLWYSNAIIVARIAGARPLASCFAEIEPEPVIAAVQAMHAAGVWHADLNAYNILLDDSRRVWLIDFDRARIGAVSNRQAANNWLRLRRSLVKVSGSSGADWWEYLRQSLVSKP